MRIVRLLLLSGLVIAVTGCVSKGRYQREVNGLQGQIAQMDVALKAQDEQNRALEAELGTLRGRGAQAQAGGEVSGGYQGATYRTPSGFELPASDIQKALKNAGYYAGVVDGKIGPDSREAIRSFQRGNGLTSDGVCGRQTWLKLKTYLDVLK